MKNKLIKLYAVLVGLILCCAITTSVAAQISPAPDAPDVYLRARVEKILDEGTIVVDEQLQEHQKLELKVLTGSKTGQTIQIDHGALFTINESQKVKVGGVVIVANPKNRPMGKAEVYYIIDHYRIPNVIWICGVFFALAIYFGRTRGITAIVGMLTSVAVIFYFVLPRIISGGDPFVACLLGSFFILFISLYLSHGFNRRTSVALISTVFSLFCAVLIDWFFVYFAKVSGTGTEEAFYLQLDSVAINLRGVLLGGIIIGCLGVLDDVTTGQSAAVEEIHKANPLLSFRELYASGISVGREHIASLINTLVLAYVGASFPLLLLYSTQKLLPFWVTLNSGFVAEEVVRTLVGSSVLVIAVPITTALAALWYTRNSAKKT